jgi:hypothetical protein
VTGEAMNRDARRLARLDAIDEWNRAFSRGERITVARPMIRPKSHDERRSKP